MEFEILKNWNKEEINKEFTLDQILMSVPKIKDLNDSGLFLKGLRFSGTTDTRTNRDLLNIIPRRYNSRDSEKHEFTVRDVYKSSNDLTKEGLTAVQYKKYN